MNESLPLSHKQLRHWVADRLRSDIVEGRLKPGEWLRQERLAQEYGVSQMPIREAFKELAAEGLVEHVPYRGVRVVEFSADDVADLYAQRGFLEGMAARAAATQITPAELEELQSLLNQMAQRLGPEHLTEYRALNRRFHQIIYEASHRAYLIRTLNQLWDAFPNMLWGNFAQTAAEPLPDRNLNDVEEHQAILEALTRHDPAAAEQLIRQHIESAAGQLVAALRRSR